MTTRLRFPPGPRGLPLLGSVLPMVRDPLAFFSKMTLEYGPLSHALVGGAHLYWVNDPSLIEDFVVGNHKSSIKDLPTRELKVLVGNGLLTSEGELWRRQRKLAAPAFQPRRITGYERAMVTCAERVFQGFGEGETRDFHVDSMRLTLEIAGETLLGVNTNDEAERIARVLEAALAYFGERLYSWRRLLPANFPTRGLRRFRKAKTELDAIVSSIVERARREANAADHLLARLIRARSDEGEAMSEQQLHDEALTMLLAGHETTALVLMFAVYALSRNTSARARLRDEIDAELGGRSVTAADLGRLPYVDAVIRETLRLYPPAYVFGREVLEPFELGGYTLPVGSQVLVSPYAMHRDPRYFPEPERFLPERWTTSEARALPRFAYLPFGGGPRICIGSHFALMEAALVLATLVQQVELEVPPSFELELAPVITMRSRTGLPVRVHRRTKLASSQPASPDADTSTATPSLAAS